MIKAKTLSREPVIKRLRRAHGHLNAIITMLREDRPSTSVVQQIRAVEVALASAKQEFVHAQMQHCLDQRDMTGGALRELKQLTRFL
jgi:DNA-binding FrmR family transcriptional regulator